MRTRPLVGRKAWFGPRRNGWGLSPASAEGWAVTLAAAVAAVLLATLDRRERWTAFLVLILLLVIVFLKGTSPGGRREWDEFKATRTSKDR